ncbi:MAG: hypothetical protein J6K25_12395 [Thermoguttaceae bacterium]|nr:hypothetical protein [Thermoguttaceae bacterium]
MKFSKNNLITLSQKMKSFDELIDRIGEGNEYSVEYKGRTYLLSDCAYLGGWQVLCDQDWEENQSYADEEEFAERATLHGDLLRDIWDKLVLA